MAVKFKFLRDAEENDKKSPQYRQIIAAISKAAGGKSGTVVEREAVVKLLEKDNKFVTRQPATRVVAYYQPQLTADKIVEVVKEPKAAAPAKSKETTNAGPAKAGGSKSQVGAGAAAPAKAS